jgi:protein-tyrosine phosphatase
MASGFLRAGVRPAGLDALVASAGTHATPGRPAEPYAVAAMEEYGVDISSHTAHLLNGADLRDAELVITMARSHLLHVVAERPDAFARTFTFKELVRRGVNQGPRQGDEPLAVWLARLNQDRRPADLLGESPLDDVDDPIGQSRRAFRRTADELDRYCSALLDLLCGFVPKGSERFVTA